MKMVIKWSANRQHSKPGNCFLQLEWNICLWDAPLSQINPKRLLTTFQCRNNPGKTASEPSILEPWMTNPLGPYLVTYAGLCLPDFSFGRVIKFTDVFMYSSSKLWHSWPLAWMLYKNNNSLFAREESLDCASDISSAQFRHRIYFRLNFVNHGQAIFILFSLGYLRFCLTA